MVWTLVREDSRLAESVEVGGLLQFNSAGALRRLATLDVGLVMSADALNFRDVERGRSMLALPDWQGPYVPVHAVTKARLLLAKTQHLVEFLRERPQVS
jgi:hypothetical protein